MATIKGRIWPSTSILQIYGWFSKIRFVVGIFFKNSPYYIGDLERDTHMFQLLLSGRVFLRGMI